MSNALQLQGGSPTDLDHLGLTNIGTNTHAQIDTHIADTSIHFTEASIDHTAISNVGVNSHAVIDVALGTLATHLLDSSIHFTEASIDHTAILNVGTNSHAAIDAHIADGTIHYAQTAIDHNVLTNLAVGDVHTQYHNDARALTWLGTRTTDDLPEGATNKYLTDEAIDDRVNNLLVAGNAITLTYNDPANTLTVAVDESAIDHANIGSIGTNTHTQIDAHIADATIHFTVGSIDHGSIAGLADQADHLWALTIDGSRALTGPWDVGGNDILNVSGFVAGAAAFTNASLIMELISTTQGFLPPSMTTAQRNAMSPAPPNGTIIFNTSLATGVGRLQMRRTSGWSSLALGGEDANTNMIVGLEESSQTEQGMLTVVANSAGTTRGTDPLTNMCSLVLEQQGAGDCGLFWLRPLTSEWQAYIDATDDFWKLRNVLTGVDIITIDPTSNSEVFKLGNGLVTLSANLDMTAPLSGARTLTVRGFASTELHFRVGIHDVGIETDNAGQMWFADFANGTTPLFIQSSVPDHTLFLEATGKVVVGGNFTPLERMDVVDDTNPCYLAVRATHISGDDAGFRAVNTNGDWRMLVGGGTGDWHLQESSTNIITAEEGAMEDLLYLKSGGLSIGDSALEATALVEMTSTTKGFLPPRMTSTQRDAISSPATGIVLYNTTDDVYNFYDGTDFRRLQAPVLPLDLGVVLGGNGNTVANFASAGNTSTMTGGIPIDQPITFSGVAVTALHFDSTSPPSTWVLRVRKNGSTTSDLATFTFNWNATSGTTEVTTGNLSSDVSLVAGDRLHVFADGSSIDVILLQVRLTATIDA